MANLKIGSNAQFLGGNLGLSIIGNHCYAYSGDFTASTTPATRLSFTTGKYYIVGEIRFAGMIDPVNAGSGGIGTMTMKMNDIIVLYSKTDAASEQMEAANVAPIIIPPLTTVLIEQDAANNESGYHGSINIVGRVYE